MANSNTYIRDGFVSAGSAQITGSLGVTGGITGSLKGTATTASYVLQAVSASYAPSAVGATFPFTGSAVITGSLNVIGNTTITGSLNITGSTTITNGALILSSSAGSAIILRTAGDSVYMLDNYGATGRSYLRIGTTGIAIHNAGADPTITCAIGMNINSAATIYSSATSHIFYGGTNKQVSIGTAAVPTAKLHIAAGAAAATSAPIKLTAGTNMTTPEAGAVEFDGNSLFFTTGSTRSTILTNTNPASITGNVSVTGTLSSTAKYILGSDLSLIPISGNQSAITTWWGMQLVGNKQSTVDYTPSAIGNNSDFSVIIPNQQAAKIGLIVRGQTSQTGNLLELRNVSNTGLSAFDSTGQLALGKTTPTATLDVNGNARITGSLLLSGSALVAGYNSTPLEGTIKDGVTSILGSLNDWNSNYYQGDVLYSETAGGTITFGQLCYRTNTETWALADASVFGAASTYMLGICVKSSTATNPTSILINGFVETATYAAILKTGEPLYMTTTPGSMSKSVPSASGNIVRIIGHTFWDSNTNTKIIIRFNPENSWIELT
jgi:hypothetical protein